MMDVLLIGLALQQLMLMLQGSPQSNSPPSICLHFIGEQNRPGMAIELATRLALGWLTSSDRVPRSREILMFVCLQKDAK